MTRHGLVEWFSRPPGQLVLDDEIRRIRALLPDLFGYHLLLVGGYRGAEILASSRILSRTILRLDGEPGEAGCPRLEGLATALPVQSDSVDVVVLPHVLEFEERPHDALREAERILVPEGHLVLAGFNPWGMMGLWRLFQSGLIGAPWAGRFIGLNRTKDWLALLGFDVVSVDGAFFRPPFGNERLMQRLQFLEAWGPRAWPLFAGAFVLLARKRVTTLTPIKTSWKPRRLVSVGLAEPSARISENE